MSICDEIFINDSIDAVKGNILKVSFKKIDSLKEDLKEKTTERILQEVNKNKETYVKFFDPSALEVIMAAEEIIRERIKAC
jgi:predicted lipase